LGITLRIIGQKAMGPSWFGNTQLRQSRKNLLLPLLQPLHALGLFQLPVGPAPFHQLADGIGQLSLTESRKIGNDLAHQIQFAGGEHAPTEQRHVARLAELSHFAGFTGAKPFRISQGYPTVFTTERGAATYFGVT
jgi:hypothetical protein